MEVKDKLHHARIHLHSEIPTAIASLFVSAKNLERAKEVAKEWANNQPFTSNSCSVSIHKDELIAEIKGEI